MPGQARYGFNPVMTARESVGLIGNQPILTKANGPGAVGPVAEPVEKIPVSAPHWHVTDLGTHDDTPRRGIQRDGGRHIER